MRGRSIVRRGRVALSGAATACVGTCAFEGASSAPLFTAVPSGIAGLCLKTCTTDPDCSAVQGHARLDTLTIPGGPALLDLTSSNLGAVDVMREAATFLIRGHRIKRVVLLGHEGCGYYKARFPYESPEAMRRRQLDDIRQAARWVSANHEALTVTSYFSTPEHERLRFDEL